MAEVDFILANRFICTISRVQNVFLNATCCVQVSGGAAKHTSSTACNVKLNI